MVEKTLKNLDGDSKWNGKAATRSSNRGRASSGQLIGIKKKLETKRKVTE